MKTQESIRTIIFAILLMSVSYTSFSQEESIRDQKNVAISLEAAWNGLSGVGLNVTYYPISNLAVDAGAGISLLSYKFGVRGRYLFMKKNFTPYVGVGFMMAPFDVTGVELTDIDTDENIRVNTEGTNFAQFIGGFEIMSGNGFLFGFNLGYALSLNSDNYTASPNTSESMLNVLDILYGGGLVAGFNLGWAF